MALQSGQIDMGQRIGAADIETLRNDSDYAVYEASGTRVQILVLNHTNAHLKDLKVRQAFASCLNYEALVSITGGIYAIAGAPYPSSAPYGYDQLDRQHYDQDRATMARMITMLSDPTEGEIILCGREIEGLKGKAIREAYRDIQMVFQDPYSVFSPRTSVGTFLTDGLP